MRTKKGTVTSTKALGTVTVTVHRHILHPLYRKRFRRSKKFLVDRGAYDVAEGDLVLIGECRPISKRKCFRILEVLTKAGQFAEMQEDEETERVMHREKLKMENGTLKMDDTESTKGNESTETDIDSETSTRPDS